MRRGGNGDIVRSIESYLPDQEFLLICLIAVCTVYRGLSADNKAACYKPDNDGTVGWIAVSAGCLVIAGHKFWKSKNFGTTVVATLAYIGLQLSMLEYPLGCVIEESRKSKHNFIAITQTVLCCLFLGFYLLIALVRNM